MIKLSFQNIFKYFIIGLIIEFLVIFCFFTALYSSYDKNVFEIKINGNLMKCYYSEKYKSAFILGATSSGYNSLETEINRVELSDNIKLEVNEYEVYYKNGTRKENTNGWSKDDDLDYRKVKPQDISIQIKRMNKVLYDGKIISNLSEYINESGRYYIHIYSTRKNNFFTSIKTHISFNVIIRGDNNG